jgi:methyl-accepting chemotaxis protein
MYRTVARTLANLSVGKKLCCGFAVVLLLTVAVSGSGFVAVDMVLRGHQHAVRLLAIDAQLLEARRLERDFALNQDVQGAQRLHDQIEQVRALLAAHLSDSATDEQPRLLAMDQAAALYLEHFDGFVQQLGMARQARATMSDAAREARDQFEMIELSLYDLVREARGSEAEHADSDPLTLAETASGLSKRMLELRDNESRYIIDSSPAALEGWNQISADLQAVAGELTLALSDEMQRTLDNAVHALTLYQRAFANYERTRQESLAIEQRMLVHAARVATLIDDAKEAREQAMRDSSGRTLVVLGGMGLCAVIIGIVAALLISRSIVVPLLRTVAFAKSIAAGDLSQNLILDRSDELGQLAIAIQEMNLSLRQLVERIDVDVCRIAAAAGQLSLSAAQTNADVQTQKVETEQAANAMYRMTAIIQEVAQSSGLALQAALAANQDAQQGNKVVLQAVSQIADLAAQIDQSSAAIQLLNEESTQIARVLEVIRNVAEQTNLLALNAAIEAARAGEQGRGFTVVADEVRALAQRAHSSTQEIESVMSRLQRMAQDAVEQMESSRALTQGTVRLATQAGDALGLITRSVSTIERLNQQIAASAEEQGAAAVMIGDSVIRVRNIGERSAHVSEQTATSSADLARLGVELQGQVQQFRT